MFHSQWSILQRLSLPSSFGFHSGCFAAIASPMADAWPSLVLVVDALLPWSLASSPECVMVVPLCGCFVAVGILALPDGCLVVGGIPGGCFVAADSLFPSLVHAAESVLALYLVDAFAAVAAGSLGG